MAKREASVESGLAEAITPAGEAICDPMEAITPAGKTASGSVKAITTAGEAVFGHADTATAAGETENSQKRQRLSVADPEGGELVSFTFRPIETHETRWDPASVRVTLNVRLDARLVPRRALAGEAGGDRGGGLRVDYGHLVVLDDFFGESERAELLDELTAPGWDHTQVGPHAWLLRLSHRVMSSASFDLSRQSGVGVWEVS
jgi:hypothetical protein